MRMDERAIRLVFGIEEEAGSITAACRRVGEELGINSDMLRGWMKQAQIDAGKRPGNVRFARPTDQLGAVVRIPCKRLGLPEPDRFAGHAGWAHAGPAVFLLVTRGTAVAESKPKPCPFRQHELRFA